MSCKGFSQFFFFFCVCGAILAISITLSFLCFGRRSIFFSSLFIYVVSISVSAYMLNGSWNWNLIEAYVPSSLCGKINGVNPPIGTDVKEYPNWNPSSDGTFSLKLTAQLICNPEVPDHPANPLFDKVWKWKSPNRIRSFLWKLVHGKLLTNVERVKRGMSSDDLCPRCCSGPETIRDCEEATQLWSRVINPKFLIVEVNFLVLVFSSGLNGIYPMIILVLFLGIGPPFLVLLLIVYGEKGIPWFFSII